MAGQRMDARRKQALANGADGYTQKRREVVTVGAAIFREKGYAETSLNDIADRLGIDRATLYYYVKGKSDILREAVHGAVDETYDYAEKLVRSTLPPEKKLQQLVTQILKSYSDNYPNMFVYIQEVLPKTHSDAAWVVEVRDRVVRIQRICEEMLNEGIERGAFRADLPVMLVLNALFGMINWTYTWYRPDGLYTPHAVTDAFMTIFLDGFRSEES